MMKSATKKTLDRGKTDYKGETDFGYWDHAQFQKYYHQISALAMVGKITPEVIHDINNYLTGILGYSELLSMKKIEDESIKNGLKNISFSAEKCKVLLANLLSLSRSETSAVHLGDVNEIIEKTIDLRRCALRHQQIEIVRDLKPKIPAVSVNVIELQKAVMHLIFIAEEALEHRNEGKKIFFKTHFDSQNHNVIMTISANGWGVSPERFSHIYQLFSTAESVGPGTGIWLKEAQQWIGDLGGTVTVEPVKGEGPCFIIRLPVKGKS